ncbi:IS66 family transposase [Dyadobacter subterraneus]|uniref:IS66 family transposase n=1 Tax=Dyadobacter subterraneus TaxID=2773304 RepID=UPI001D169EB9|nr:IS66 family transposase [Dyadobacter subterraneus]
MEDTATDYKLLYEQEIAAHKKSLELISEKDEQIQTLNFQLDKYKQYIFGKKNEKLASINTDVNQINLFELGIDQPKQEELSEQAAEVVKEKVPAKKREKGTGRMILPENLRREIIIIEPTEDVTGCTIIGEEVTEVLDLIPAEFFVKRYIRYKYARANGEGIITASLPDRVIEKGIPSEAVIAQMVVDKYVFGLPLHRQIDKYRRLGVNVPASTASDWIIKGWQHLTPLWELLKLLVLNQRYLQADESPLKVLDRDHKNGIHQGYMWIYNAPCDKLTLFDYRRGRDQSGPKQMLEGYAGILQVDGYVVYEKLFGNHPEILLVYCMAHARRRFIDALKYDEQKATYVLERMQLLYVLEKQMREEGLNWEEKTKLRQEKSIPVLLGLKEWMTQQLPLVIPKSPLGQAIAYSLPRWEGLSAYALHGQIEIDNNLAENVIRPLAIGYG